MDCWHINDGNLDPYLRGYSGDAGPAIAARLGMPYGLAVDPNGNVYVADLPNAALRVLQPAPIANAASGTYGPIAAGEIVTLYGSGLGPGTLTTGDAGTQVLFNGVAGTVIYSSTNQVAAIVPSITGATAAVEVHYLGKTALSFAVPVVASAPALFTSDSVGRGLVAAIDQDGAYNSMTSSAFPGTMVQLFTTGDGLAAQPDLPVAVTIGGVAAQVVNVGPADGSPGVTRIDVKVPANALAATPFRIGQSVHVPALVVVQVGGVSTQVAVYLTVFASGPIG